MGHLTLVAEEVVEFSERHSPELLSQAVMDKILEKAWIDYVELTLSDQRSESEIMPFLVALGLIFQWDHVKRCSTPSMLVKDSVLLPRQPARV